MSSGHARVNYALLIDGKVELWSLGDRGMDQRELSDFDQDETAALPLYTHLFGEQPIKNLPSKEAVDELADSMVADHAPPTGCVPAGYTYLSQFIFHDLTWLSGKGPLAQNRASAALDLDSVLGNTFTDAEPGCPGSADALRIGMTLNGPFDGQDPVAEDVPRKPRCQPLPGDDLLPGGFPLIPDTRNEGFLQLAQTHVAFLHFYNAVATRHGFGGQFDEAGAKQEFMEHVQAVVLHDLLETLIDPIVYDDVVIKNNRLVVHPGKVTTSEPFVIPIEFACGAARYGHSMVRPDYDWNDTHSGSSSATLLTLLTLSHQNTPPGLEKLTQLERDWPIDWQRFFDFSPLLGVAALDPVKASLISPKIAMIMGHLPEHLRVTPLSKQVPSDDATFNLARETLHRQLDFKMASAQEVFKAMEYLSAVTAADELTPGELAGTNSQTSDAFDHHSELKEKTPIWFYVLREAEVKGCGNRLGPLGSRLVAETLHAAIEASRSCVMTSGPGWKPKLPSHDPLQFKMIDLIAFACSSNTPN